MSALHFQPRIGYILRSYPRLSQTFILNEILALEERGVHLDLFPITDPGEQVQQPQVANVRGRVQYLEQAWKSSVGRWANHARLMLSQPLRYFSTLRYVVNHTELDEGYTASSRFACFEQAVYMLGLLHANERETGQTIDHVHAHFAHDPTLIALLVHKLSGLPFSFTAHARDLVQIPAAVLIERITAAEAIVTCCVTNIDYIKQVVPEALQHKVRLIHHGVDLCGFQPVARTLDAAESPLILSVGRLVEKKGFGTLLQACAQLKQAGYRFRCQIFGDGPLREALNSQITALDIADMVELAGECSQDQLIPLYQRADIFVLAPLVTDDGDRDGVPNVLVEAMACAVPVVSTAVAGIPELISHAVNGLLAPGNDVATLTTLIAQLLDDPAQRLALGAAGRSTVIEHFDLRRGASQLAALFADTIDQTSSEDGLKPRLALTPSTISQPSAVTNV